MAYSNDAIKTGDALLLSGLSFSGSSGSPVVAHPERMRTMRVLGVMSGHLPEAADGRDRTLVHGGLSYMTRATSVRALIAVARAAGFRASAIYSGLESARQSPSVV